MVSPSTSAEKTPQAFAQYVADYDAALDTLLTQGLAAWKVANNKPGLDKVLYTLEPRNPATGRFVSAYLFMTPLAVALHGQDLYKMYQEGMARRESEWTGSGQPVNFDEFQRTLLLDTVPVNPKLAHQVPNNIKAMTKAAAPTKTGKTKYDEMGADGYATRISVRAYNVIDHDRTATGKAFLALLDNKKIGGGTAVGDRYEWRQGHFEHMAINRAGADGVDWLVDHGFTPNIHWYLQAFHTKNGDSATVIWDRLAARGVDPTQADTHGTLWHSVLRNLPPTDATPLFDWLKAHKVDWHKVNGGGELPLSTAISVASRSLGMQDFYGTDPLGKMAAAMMKGWPGADQEMEEEKAGSNSIETLIMDMLRDGVDPTHKDKKGRTPLHSIHPEQTMAERHLANTTGEHLFFCDHEKLRRTPEAYGPVQLAFIRRLEQASGKSLLDDPANTSNLSAKPKKPGR